MIDGVEDAVEMIELIVKANTKVTFRCTCANAAQNRWYALLWWSYWPSGSADSYGDSFEEAVRGAVDLYKTKFPLPSGHP